MSLTPEQKQAVSAWIAAGDNLSAVQKKLSDEFKISMTYRDVRFLVDDLDLAIKDPAPKVDTNDVTKAAPKAAPAAAGKAPAGEKKGFFDKAKEKLGLAKDEGDAVAEDAEPMDEEADDLPAGGAGGVTVSVDKV